LYPATKVIVFTAMNDPEIRERSLAVGASAFVSKLARVGELISAIQRSVSIDIDPTGA
jgi:DNA-binding NarL/FixJ family response regulator